MPCAPSISRIALLIALLPAPAVAFDISSSRSIPIPSSSDSSVFSSSRLSESSPYGPSIAIVSKQSLFADSYSISRLSDKKVVEIVSKKTRQVKGQAAIRDHLGKNYKLNEQNLAEATEAMDEADKTIGGWLDRLDQVADNDQQLAQMAHAADALLLNQLRMEAQLHHYAQPRFTPESRDRYQRSAIQEFQTHLNSVTTH